MVVPHIVGHDKDLIGGLGQLRDRVTLVDFRLFDGVGQIGYTHGDCDRRVWHCLREALFDLLDRYHMRGPKIKGTSRNHITYTFEVEFDLGAST